MNEQAWDDAAATFDEDIFAVPEHDREKILQRYAGKGPYSQRLQAAYLVKTLSS